MNLRLLIPFILTYGLGCLLLPQQGWGQCDRRSDSLELVKLYNATNGTKWTIRWDLETSMSEWYGVSLSADGCVTKLSLGSNNLDGNIFNLNLPNLTEVYLSDNLLKGEIPSFNLPQLVELWLNSNQFTGNVPNFNSSSLKVIALNNNQLSGSIPNFNLPELTKLYLSANQLSGAIPNFSLPKLTELWLNSNKISGIIPSFKLPSLTILALNDNQLSGEIPNLNTPQLSRLYLSTNQLTGKIPDFSLPKLTELYLNENQLNGEIPNFNLPLLAKLNVSRNQLSGKIPAFNLPQLIELHLGKNKFSSFQAQNAIPKLGTSSTGSNLLLTIDQNKLSFDGLLANVSLIQKLSTKARYAPQDSIYRDTIIRITEGQSLSIDLGIDSAIADNQYAWTKNSQAYKTITGDNKLTFTSITTADADTYYVHVTNPRAPLLTLYGRRIKIEVSNSCRMSDSLELVKLYHATDGPNWKNKWDLGKPISTWYGINLNQDGCVTSIYLYDNQLEGTIPNLNLNKLEDLQLYNNKLRGNIPNFNLPNLKYLWLHMNQLSGGIPSFNLPQLEELYLADNPLEGNIPDLKLPNLIKLLLYNNQLSGNIPNFNLPKLQEIQLYKNKLTGEIPNFSLPNLKELWLFKNELIGGVPAFDLPNLVRLNFSENKLNGIISNLKLPKLVWLYLQYNQLGGNIPNFNLPNLTELDLTKNQLSGGIPNFNLPNLTVLNLSQNQLSGIIPNFNLPNLTALYLKSNRLTGAIPNFKMPNLRSLYLNNNQLNSSVKWSLLTSIGTGTLVFDSLTLYRNNLSFDDILPNIALINKMGSKGIYAPQDSIYRDTIIRITLGQPLAIDLGIDASIEDNRYTWFKNDQAYTTLTGNNKLNFNAIKTTDAGTYRVVVTNPQAPALNLFGRKIKVLVLPDTNSCRYKDSLELVKLYNETLGSQWGTPWKLTAPITSWHGVLLDKNGCVTSLDMDGVPDGKWSTTGKGNKLSTKQLPLLNLPKLTFLNLNSNKIGGAVPAFKLPLLKELLMADNQLEQIPSNLELPELIFLDLTNNALQTIIPDFNQLKKLKYLRLSGNKLKGNIPNFQLPDLIEISLFQNELTGTIPEFNLPELETVHLGNNIGLTGSIPKLSASKKLKYFYVGASTGLTGTFPATFAADHPQLLHLAIIGTNLTGSIPSFEQCPNLIILDFSKNKFTGSIPGFNLAKLERLWLSGNKLTGTIPNFNLPQVKSIFLNDMPGLMGTLPNLNLCPKIESLRIDGNRITSLPNLSAKPFKKDSSYIAWPNFPQFIERGFKTQNNLLTFDDIILNLQVSSVASFNYAPQDSIYRDTSIRLNIGETLNIDLGIDPNITTNLYQWYKNGQVYGSANNSNKFSIKNLQISDTGIYRVQVSNPAAPALTLYSKAIRLEVQCPSNNFKINLLPQRDTICLGDSLRMSVSSGLRYTWNNGSTAASVGIKPTQNSSYSVVVEDAVGCKTTLLQNITVIKNPQVRLSIIEDNCSFMIDGRTEGGKSPYTYRWNTGNTEPQLRAVKPGTYSLQIRDRRNCVANASISVDSFSLQAAPPERFDANCGETNGVIELKLRPERPVIEWFPSDQGSGENPRTGLSAGTYRAIITDGQGCKDTVEVTLNKAEDCDKDFLIYRSFSPNGDGVNETFTIKAKQSGGCPSGGLGECYPNNELIIINRWGEVVYRKRGYESDWDAEALPSGAYFFMFYPDRDKPKGVIRGALTVLK